tara:strand:+ start:293 stop:595 length:303 start_codon:yes stop_codon:yes gene_type:complete
MQILAALVCLVFLSTVIAYVFLTARDFRVLAFERVNEILLNTHELLALSADLLLALSADSDSFPADDDSSESPIIHGLLKDNSMALTVESNEKSKKVDKV